MPALPNPGPPKHGGSAPSPMASSSSSSSRYAGSAPSPTSTSSPSCSSSSPSAALSSPRVAATPLTSDETVGARASLVSLAGKPGVQPAAAAAALMRDTPCRPCSLTDTRRSAKKPASAAVADVRVLTMIKSPSKVTLTTPDNATTLSKIAALTLLSAPSLTFRMTSPRPSLLPPPDLPTIAAALATSASAAHLSTLAAASAPPSPSNSSKVCRNSCASSSSTPSAAAALQRASADCALLKSKRRSSAG
mmetsp:Transcript_1775/g.4515  ORF Transcript_1775/g.4515 Transcript_1775/m.4515 type:complete len:249 (-) Transcript_1775:232-978(-)